MPKSYVGLACSGHDNALAIVDADGGVRFAEAAERYLQNKRAIDAPPDDLFRIGSLISSHCDPDADLVLAKSWSEHAGSLNRLSTEKVQDAIAAMRAYGSEAISSRTRSFVEFQLARLLGRVHIAEMGQRSMSLAGRNLVERCASRHTETRAYDHHLTHAANACYSSPFDEAVCAIVDGLGEGRSVSFFRYARGRIEPLPLDGPSAWPTDDQPSLGLLYADLCMLCGFDPWKGEEWKVMGLAPYGRCDERILGLLRGCLRVDGLRLVRPETEATALLRLSQLSRRPDEPIARAADLARTGQAFFEEILLELCANLHARHGCDNLVLGGGCALNSSANGKILRNTPFRGLFVPCCPGDDGNALGAAWLAFYEDHGPAAPRREPQSPYLGSLMSRDSLERAATSGAFTCVMRMAPDAMASTVARRLSTGDLVGWIQGHAELGPRALGHRSILADPRRAEMKAKINAAVKFREEFRPFAPAILEEHAEDFFDPYEPSPYMERTLPFRTTVRDRVPAVVHADGTGRLQTVSRERTPRFYDLIRCFHELTGVPVLLNTSFNVMGKPIVHSVEDALAVFTTSGIDVLVIEDYLFAKRAESGQCSDG